MNKRNRSPWLFGLLTALILLTGGTAVGLAARLVVAPQAGQTVQVDTPTLPSVMGQSVDEVMFYPWNQYDPTRFSGDLAPELEDQAAWYSHHLTDGAAMLGLTLQGDWDIQDGLMGADVCYWKDRPVVTQAGQSALLDVAYGTSSRDFGMTWVARSTGELPTRAQKEAAVATVQRDVCALFHPEVQSGGLSQTLQALDTYLLQFRSSQAVVSPEWYAAEVLSTICAPISPIAATASIQTGQSPQQRLESISSVAQDMNYYIQLVTTQRQVVVVLTQFDSTLGDWYTVGVYYDAVLEQYSGVVLNGHTSA